MELSDVLAEVVERDQLDDAAVGNSSARLERAVLRDGRRRVLKYLPPEGDWLTRATTGSGRMRHLWGSGVLVQVDATVDHTVETVVTAEGTDVVVMRDVSPVLLPPRSMVSRADASRLLAGLARFHADWVGCELAELCEPAARYAMFAPAVHAADRGPGVHPARDFIVTGWEAFADLIPGEVSEAVFAVHADPAPLADALMASAPSTLLHGDAKLENLGLDGERLVAIDWGELTGVGPAEIDVVWFTVQDGWRLEALPGELFAAYDAHAPRQLDPRALDLACIGALAQFGFKMAGRYRAGDAATRARAWELLTWWTARVRTALSTWSPV